MWPGRVFGVYYDMSSTVVCVDVRTGSSLWVLEVGSSQLYNQQNPYYNPAPIVTRRALHTGEQVLDVLAFVTSASLTEQYLPEGAWLMAVRVRDPLTTPGSGVC